MTHGRCLIAVVSLALAGEIAACSPTYDPVCRGEGAQQLNRGELAQPSGMALGAGNLYVANAAAVAPVGDYDYCGSFISVLNPATGAPVSNPLVPRDSSLPRELQTYRFFSDITYDTSRNVLYVAERQRGGILKVDPSNGKILGRVAAGHAPYSLALMPGIETLWPGDASPVTRDVLAVGDLGHGSDTGHLWFIDLQNFTFRGAREAILNRAGRPGNLLYDAAQRVLFVAHFDGTGVTELDVRTLKPLRGTESLLNDYSLLIRGLALTTDATARTLYFTSESSAFNGLWSADAATGQLLANLKLPASAFALAAANGNLIGLASNRLYVIQREPLALVSTRILGLPQPARLLVDATAKRAYVTSVDPSRVKIVRLP